jgi:hypothetical protein
LNSREITTTVTFLSTPFTTYQITKNLKSNSTDILVSQMIVIATYIASECDGHWWQGIIQERQDCMFCAASSAKLKQLLAVERRLLLY